MPELPEVELVKRDLEKIIGLEIVDYELSNYVINGHKINKRTIVKQPLDEFRRVQNSTILSIGRRGKYMYFSLRKENIEFNLVAHLGMSGAFFIVNHLDEISEKNFKKHWQVIFHLLNGQMLVYSDIRRFGEMRIVESLEGFKPIAEMAPEYTEEIARAHFIDTLKSGRYDESFIKPIIMDSKILPGVGNIYASEALYLSHILPTKRVKNISRERLSNLFDAIVEVFELSLSYGGSTISDYRSVTGGSGEMQNKFKVYGLNTCPEGHTLKTKVMNGRNTYYCTKCQR
ncbi:Fpg/Nei family DNA glycosylase [Phocicoccus pinnipedialis]|uniref:Formamidopyrimidine-DNA glycosylase n=1 Tax=Phocicoccus pinnipedialis TaxID=110845 RepID=A0A6V7RC46_9BACL|nr:DNA-formamidopyrimidine glycosylase family protein [Jeotgalicoccus pinnipedialis]MBP1939489.1 formamidopyrimidine-DNA glycosylase [Jeotgalicoccus pinnipedialis]CAD2075176.1 Formamidopyrimidine-DNA glycosylase [Jeotgalicoccus pinnipedialis]